MTFAELSGFPKDMTQAVSRVGSLSVMTRVIAALILRDMRTRYGRHFSGWLIMVLWPLGHLCFLGLGYLMAHRIAPFGSSITVFIGTGVLPYILCFYPARMIMLCLVQNQPLLQFPPVQPIDIVLARSTLEIINGFWVVSLFCFGLYAFDVDFLPHDYTEAVLAIMSTIYLGFSIGFISAILYKLVRAWLAVQIGLLILMYIASGAFMPIWSLPQWMRTILWFNPLVHSVEWLRAAYYETTAYGIISKSYLIGYSTVLIFIALVLERAVRGRLMQA